MRAGYSLSCGRFYFFMPRVLLPIRKRGYCLSCRGVIVYHAAGLIAYQVAGLLSIIPRGYSAGGSALSCRWVLLFSIMRAVYIIMRAVYIIMQRVLLSIIPRGLHHHSAGL